MTQRLRRLARDPALAEVAAVLAQAQRALNRLAAAQVRLERRVAALEDRAGRPQPPPAAPGGGSSPAETVPPPAAAS